jgi:MFS family permease
MSSASSPMPVTSSDQISISKIWGVIMASSVGTMIEWYDFYIFGTLAPYLAPKFYPPGNQLFAYIAYLATFAVGFMVRPFGALFFGRIGDLVGRKYAFIVTLTIMGGATALVGALPSFATAGWFSPVILIALRVLQGLALNMAVRRSTSRSTCPTINAASTPALSRSRPLWACSFQLPSFWERKVR